MIKLCYRFGRNVMRPAQTQQNDTIKQLVKEGKSNIEILKQMTPKKKPILDEGTLKIKERAHTAVQQVKEDISFKNLAKQDQKESNKDLDIFTDESKRGDSRLKSVKIVDKEDSFVVQQQNFDKLKEIMTLQDQNGLLKDLVKDEMFINKKLQEQDFAFAEGLKKLEKQRKLRKVQKDLNSVEWDDNPDMSLTLQANKKFTEQDSSQPVSYLIKDPYALQKFRTTQNMTEFVHQFLFDRKPVFEIVVNGVDTNASCTVVFIFWQLTALQQAQQSKIGLTLDSLKGSKEELIKQLNSNQQKVAKQLKQFSGYMGGQMCQALGLKFAPQMRFVVSTRLQNFMDMKQEMMDHQEDMMQAELVEKYKEGKIGRKVSQEDYIKMVDDMEDGIMDHAYAEAQETPTTKPKKNLKNKKVAPQLKSDKFWNQL